MDWCAFGQFRDIHVSAVEGDLQSNGEVVANVTPEHLAAALMAVLGALELQDQLDAGAIDFSLMLAEVFGLVRAALMAAILTARSGDSRP